jgi:carbon storage regulator
MLVLSRKVGEEIVIGDNIRVRVVSVQGNQIRLGFDAPREVSIQRAELLERAEREAAARTAAQVSDKAPTVPAEPAAVKA